MLPADHFMYFTSYLLCPFPPIMVAVAAVRPCPAWIYQGPAFPCPDKQVSGFARICQCPALPGPDLPGARRASVQVPAVP